ncbi:hypothetical protein LTR04_000645, partial [Oleoguttula sp. CCFEE 6159]
MPPSASRKRPRAPSPHPPPSSSAKSVTKSATNAALPQPQATRQKTTLFDVLDAPSNPKAKLAETRAFLESLDKDSDSELSDISSDEFEDVACDVGASKRRKLDHAGAVAHGNGNTGTGEDEEDGDEEEMDWEDAIVHTRHDVSTVDRPIGDLEITLDDDIGETRWAGKDAVGKKGPTRIERQVRVQTHCMHVQFLLWHNVVRNGWCCDKEVQRILAEQLTPGMKKELDRFRIASGMEIEEPAADTAAKNRQGKKKLRAGKGGAKDRSGRDWGADADRLEEGVPNLSRGDPLLRFLKIVTAFWRKKFRITAPALRKQGYKPLERLGEEVRSFQKDEHDADEHGERIKDVEEFRELAKKCEGSRDVGAQLFTALLRGLGLEARLVASLQPVGFGWGKNEEATPKKKKWSKGGVAGPMGKEKEAPMSLDGESEDESGPQGRSPALTNGASTALKLKKASRASTRGGKGAPINLDDDGSEHGGSPSDGDDDSVIDVTPSTSRKRHVRKYGRDVPTPTYWTEVLSPVTKTYIPVDPIVLSTVASNFDLLSTFEPRGKLADRTKQVFAYIVAYSADGTAKDVTVRYLKRRVWPGKTKGVRMPAEKVPVYNKRGKVKKYEDYDWFKTVMSGYARPAKDRTAADDLEDTRDLQIVRPAAKPKTEGETLQGYKNSADFVLERHLRREEALLPTAAPVKTFTSGKGASAKSEPVFRRADVVVCKTVESWHKEGREILPGSQPLKFVPIRAVTLLRKREVEEAQRDTGEKPKQGLYALHQTTWIIPDPIVDGRIPRNAFGNIDVYVPTMVPRGAVHLPLRGAARVCRKLAIDYAEAVTGFEFGAQRAVPVLTGVVVAAEHGAAVVEAWKVEEEERRRKEDGKREKAALHMWRKLLMGLRIVQRVREDYGNEAPRDDEVNPFTNRDRAVKKGTEKKHATAATREADDLDADAGGGGFLTTTQDDPHAGGGGFLLSGHHDDDNDEEVEADDFLTGDHAGGGFLLETDAHHHHHQQPSTRATATPATASAPTSYPQTPISLQSAHRRQDSPQDVAASTADSDGEDENEAEDDPR